MNFNQWVAEIGGPKEAKEKLGFRLQTIWALIAGRRMPGAAKFLKIHEASRGKVQYHLMAETFLSYRKRHGSKPKTKKTKK